jgi:hypothetical protein
LSSIHLTFCLSVILSQFSGLLIPITSNKHQRYYSEHCG